MIRLYICLRKIESWFWSPRLPESYRVLEPLHQYVRYLYFKRHKSPYQIGHIIVINDKLIGHLICVSPALCAKFDAPYWEE